MFVFARTCGRSRGGHDEGDDEKPLLTASRLMEKYLEATETGLMDGYLEATEIEVVRMHCLGHI